MGLIYTPPKYWQYLEVGARATTGNKEDANSPHQTLGGDSGSSKVDINIDKVYIKRVSTATVGRGLVRTPCLSGSKMNISGIPMPILRE